MGRRWILWSITILAVLTVASPATAATRLSMPVSGGIVVAFGATYETAGRSLTHRGVDMLGTPAETVRAACDGIVTFAGEVPADGGGRTHAVTIRSDDGLLVCVSPLGSVCVSTGESVGGDRAIGTLAASGDGSWACTHAHLSVREGGVYVDPTPLLVAPAADAPANVPTAAPSDSGGAGTATMESPTVDAGARSGAAAGVGASVPAASVARAGVAAPLVDAARIRTAYAAGLGVLRSPTRSPQARLLCEARLADSVERPALGLRASGRTLVNGGALAGLVGAAGAVAARRRLACVAAHDRRPME